MTRPAEPGTVEIANFAFGPSDLTVSVGATVTWTNADNTTHTVTGNDDIIRAFALNAAASAVDAPYLVLRADVFGPFAGIGVTLGTLVAFVLTRRGEGLLDFREVGLTNPSPEALITLVTEGLALVVLALAVLEGRRATWSPRS